MASNNDEDQDLEKEDRIDADQPEEEESGEDSSEGEEDEFEAEEELEKEPEAQESDYREEPAKHYFHSKPEEESVKEHKMAPSNFSDLEDNSAEEDHNMQFTQIRKNPDEYSNYRISSSNENQKKSNKTTIILLIILIIILVGGGFLLLRGRNALTSLVSKPTPAPTEEPTPTPTPAPTLNKSDWSLEVLNGTTQSGLAKKIADQIAALGYPVVKVGNADKQNYDKTQILVKKGMEDKVDLVIADLKDVIKIASFGGELKEGTASARIIIGKDSI